MLDMLILSLMRMVGASFRIEGEVWYSFYLFLGNTR